MTLNFIDYQRQRHEAFDFLKNLKNKAQQAVGLQNDQGKSSLDKYTAVQAGKAGAAAGGAASDLIGKTANVAANVATGNVVGAAFSIWDWIKTVASGSSSLKSFGSAGQLVGKDIMWDQMRDMWYAFDVE